MWFAFSKNSLFPLHTSYSLNLFYSIGLGGIIVLIIVVLFNKYGNIGEQFEDDTTQFCDDPSCHRCSKNSKLNQTAKYIFLNMKEKRNLQRVGKAIIGNDNCDNTNSENSLAGVQYILYVHGLTSNSIWSIEDLPESYKSDYHILKENIDIFTKEFYGLPTVRTDSYWTKVFLRNQGVVINENYSLCTGTSPILNKCTNIMTDCVFAYTFFSILHPNSSIAEHYGPTNSRIRCHVSLKVPHESEQCEMDVAGTKVQWKDKGIVFFDDSLNHSVRYTTKQQDSVDRIVLLIDFWHPDLSLVERKCIKKCYSPHR